MTHIQSFYISDYGHYQAINPIVFSHFLFILQLRKQFPSMNLKIPAKRIFGDNFDPGKALDWYKLYIKTKSQYLKLKIDASLFVFLPWPMLFTTAFYCILFYNNTCICPIEFIKQRRAGLHEFIKRIVSHPQLCNQ